MIKQFIKIGTILLFALFALTACDSSESDKPLPKGDYENGYFISNEGNFGSPNASVTFVSEDLNFTENAIYKTVNGQNLGDVLQSIAFDDDYAYLILNNSNKIEVVNRYTFKSIHTITEDVGLPRFALVENGKLYVTNSDTQSVNIYNTTDFGLDNSIEIGAAVEQLEEDNGFLYVQNAAFGSGNSISVIDLNDNSIVKTITTGDGLNSIALDDDVLYALHSSGITKINTNSNEIIADIYYEEGLENTSKIQVSDEAIYFIAGANIYKYDKNVATLANTPLVNTNVNDASWFIGYGFSVIDDKLFYTDVKGFSENSEVLVYDTAGNLLKTLSAGIGASGVYAND